MTTNEEALLREINEALENAEGKPFERFYTGEEFGGTAQAEQYAGFLNVVGLIGEFMQGAATGEGPTGLADHLGITDEQIKVMTALAIRRYQSKQYEEASDLFAFLTQADPLVPEHFKHWGACMQQLNDVPGAIRAYSVAIGLDPVDAETLFYLAQCRVMEADIEKADALLSSAAVVMAQYPDKFTGIVKPMAALQQFVEAAKSELNNG